MSTQFQIENAKSELEKAKYILNTIERLIKAEESRRKRQNDLSKREEINAIQKLVKEKTEAKTRRELPNLEQREPISQK